MGARDRRFIAETTYDIVRWYRLLGEVTGAAADDFWKLLGGWLLLNDIELPTWGEFDGLSRSALKKSYDGAQRIRKVRESVPDWLDTLGETEVGTHWEKELQSLNEEASVVLRVNTLKTDRKALRQRLEEEGVYTLVPEDFADALVLLKNGRMFSISLRLKKGCSKCRMQPRSVLRRSWILNRVCV